jgi:cytochrome c-type biogenesis protein CcmH
MGRTTTHSILLSVLACLAIAPAAGARQPVEPQASLPDIEDEVMCPVCGTLLELASEAPQAQQQRAQIRDLIAQGYTKDEIKDALVAEYGEDVLATPDTEGFDLAAWLVPGLAFVVAAVAIFVGLRRWRRDGSKPAMDDETRGAPGAPDAGDSKRLDEDLARYDL